MKKNPKKTLLIFLFFLIFILVLAKTFHIKYRFFTKLFPSLNLLIISVDSLPANRMEVYGYDKNTTPGISQWAKKATVFTNLNVSVPNTVPSMVTLLTGQSSFTSKITQCITQPINKNTPTLASILKKNNFMTGAFYTFSNLLPQYSNLDKGFDIYSFVNSRNNYSELIKASRGWLNRNKNKRFFLWLYIRDPAVPFTPPKDLECKFNANSCHVIKSKSLAAWDKERAKLQGCRDNSAEEVLPIETLYDGEVAQTDRVVTTILNNLQDSGLDKNTVVVFTSATGEGLDHNYYFYQGEVLYDSAVRVPLIIKNPAIFSNNAKVDRLIDNTDILPTLLDLLNIPAKNLKTDGISFSDAITNNFIAKLLKKDQKNYVYATNINMDKFSIFDGRYKFIYSLNNTCLYNNQKEELYDFKKDPDEINNALTAKKELAKELKKRLLDYLSKYNLP